MDKKNLIKAIKDALELLSTNEPTSVVNASNILQNAVSTVERKKEPDNDMNTFKKELKKKLDKAQSEKTADNIEEFTQSIVNIIYDMYEALPPPGRLAEAAYVRCIALCALAEGFQRIEADTGAYIHDFEGKELLLRMDRDIHALLQEHGASFDKPLLKKIRNVFSNSNYAWFQAYGLFDGIDLVSGPVAVNLLG